MRFFKIECVETKKGVVVQPAFYAGTFEDLMIRGGKFYAIFDYEAGLWSTNPGDVIRIVDDAVKRETVRQADEGTRVMPVYLKNANTRMWERFLQVSKTLPDNYHVLDSTVTFAGKKPDREDYISKHLSYALEEKETPAYEKLISTLYDPKEREKIEWFLGSIVAGESRYLQKFLVLFGDPGSGKSTIINLATMLFDIYTKPFHAEALGVRGNSFAMEPFATNPLLAYDNEADLSRVETNTRLNSIVSHDTVEMNEKYKSKYSIHTDTVLLIATNSPVRITDAKSGIIRRLIDVNPSGRKLPFDVYQQVVSQMQFERGGIAWHCMQVYKSLGRTYYDDYKPIDMIERTDIFFNFVEEHYDIFAEEDSISLKRAFDMYKTYMTDASYEFGLSKNKFRDELRNYFREFHRQKRLDDGTHVKNFYEGFITEKFDVVVGKKEEPQNWIVLKEEGRSLLDELLADQPAQYAGHGDKPRFKWSSVKTTLSELITSRVHYVKLPENHVVVDFDLKDELGNKSLELNLEAARLFPRTYCEVSKGGSGLHLHYIYDGDVDILASTYAKDIEVKVFKGNSSLRRRVSKFTKDPIVEISDGLPIKEVKKVLNKEVVVTEKNIRFQIERNLRREVMGHTKPSIDLIKKILDEAYDSGVPYDVRDLRPKVMVFANNSTNQAAYCLKQVAQMHFFSEQTPSNCGQPDDAPIVFFDIEVFPNLFLVNWKFQGEDKACVRMINPTPKEVEDLFKFRLIGFNNRRYDNHILYARYLGYTVSELYMLSQRIINDSRNGTFSEAYNLSYTDVYDFASAPHKKSLKKYEIELGLHHKELGLPWDQSVPEDRWLEVAEYCDNDVVATEAVFNYLSGDWMARQILARLSGLTVNDTTNQHTIHVVFGNDRRPQDKLVYTDLSKEFPGYTFQKGKSYYLGEETGEGGYVYAEPGIHYNVALLDIESMHPTTIDVLEYLGPYKERYSALKKARVAIKHKDFSVFDTLLDGILKPIVEEIEADGMFSLKDLSNALKTALNSAYGLTSAKFDNPFRHKDNIDNIVAKRGALFMVNLKHEVQNRGYTVAHIKTDSIKIPEADDSIIEFVMEYGKQYGYNFEHEATYEKMCLVNNAVYIAKDMGDGHWTATGAEFAHPYIFKTLFTKEDVEFKDLCETKSVKSALYLDFNETLAENEHDYHFVGRVGSFCPMREGAGGGELVRDQDGKMNGVTGTVGYRWMEAEMVTSLGAQDLIDMRYFSNLAKDAYDHIGEFGDPDLFIFGEASPPWEASTIPEPLPF